MKKTPVNMRIDLTTAAIKEITLKMLLELESKIDNNLLIKIDNNLSRKIMTTNLYQKLARQIKKSFK